VTPQRHSELKRLFLQACDLSEELQRSFVERNCPDDEMRASLDALLEQDRSFDASRDDRSSPLRLAPLAPDLAPGDEVGPYRVVRLLGEGGMGSVYLARQERPLRREVALKVIKPGMDTREVVARFESERQALAMMEHPAIARVYDAGATSAGRPYFAMELVDGEPVAAYADRMCLNVRQRVELMIEIADAVQHAHQKGVIHRDLKPSNVLVVQRDGAAVVKVIDFGVAKAAGCELTERTLATAQGQFLGTPAYMSPEQAAGRQEQIDTRTDVFALGVMLYELLVGAPPFEPATWRAASVPELQRRIAELDPPRPTTRLASMPPDDAAEAARRRGCAPSVLRRALRGDLEWIALRAMERQRQRRYPGAAEFAADLRRHLADEPVLASPPGARRQARKFIRRHRVGVAAAALLGAGAALGVAGLTIGLLRAQRAEAVAVERRLEAERQAAIAGEVNDFLNEILASANPRTTSAAIDLTVRDALDQAGENIEGRFEGEPEVEAALRKTIGWAYTNLGVFEQAERHLRRAIELRRSAHDEDHPAVHDALNDYALMLIDLQRLDEAREVLLQKLDSQRRTEPLDESEYAVTLNNLGLIHLYQQEGAEAEEYLSQSLAIRRRLLTPPHEMIAVTMHNIAGARFLQGRLDEAIPMAREAYEMRVETLPPDHPDRSQSLNALAYMLERSDRMEEAEPLFRETLAMRRRIYGDRHPSVAQAMNNLGGLLIRMERTEEGLPLLTEASEIWKETLGPTHRFVRGVLGSRAAALQALGRDEEAERTLLDCLHRTREADDAPPTELASTLAALARVRFDLKRFHDAEEALLEAVALDNSHRPALQRLREAMAEAP